MALLNAMAPLAQLGIVNFKPMLERVAAPTTSPIRRRCSCPRSLSPQQRLADSPSRQILPVAPPRSRSTSSRPSSSSSLRSRTETATSRTCRTRGSAMSTAGARVRSRAAFRSILSSLMPWLGSSASDADRSDQHRISRATRPRHYPGGCRHAGADRSSRPAGSLRSNRPSGTGGVRPGRRAPPGLAST